MNQGDLQDFQTFCLFCLAIGIGIARWTTDTVYDEQLRLLKAWRPSGYEQ